MSHFIVFANHCLIFSEILLPLVVLCGISYLAVGGLIDFI